MRKRAEKRAELDRASATLRHLRSSASVSSLASSGPTIDVGGKGRAQDKIRHPRRLTEREEALERWAAHVTKITAHASVGDRIAETGVARRRLVGLRSKSQVVHQRSLLREQLLTTSVHKQLI